MREHVRPYFVLLLGLTVAVSMSLGKDKVEPSPIDIYIREAANSDSAQALTAGSLYTKAGILSELSRDLRARQVNDIVTIIVSDRASAVSRGVTNTGRKSSAKASVGSLLGKVPEMGALANLAELGGSNQLQGQGETSRETTLTTTISARVTHVLPNGYLVVQGEKQIWVNSERQQVTIRGVVRWNDIGAANEVPSDRLANLDVRVNGKGVVGDAIKRPNILYRLLLGILPF